MQFLSNTLSNVKAEFELISNIVQASGRQIKSEFLIILWWLVELLHNSTVHAMVNDSLEY